MDTSPAVVIRSPVLWLTALALILLSACRTSGGLDPVLKRQLEKNKAALAARKLRQDQITTYKKSFALLVGNSRYEHWAPLNTVPAELDKVGAVLTQHGFEVTRRDNVRGVALERTFKDFMKAHGGDLENRLLIYFSGHGHSSNDRGFLVATDAPKPPYYGALGPAFEAKSLPLSKFIEWSREVTANHVLFVLDSCFSGSVFLERGIPETVKNAMTKPTRQFITAGTAKEKVPSVSVFTPAFVEALSPENRAADYNKDGYVTGMELGLYLINFVPTRRRSQHPRYGWHPDPNWSEGDMVFTLPASTGKTPTPVPRPPEIKSETTALVDSNGQKVEVPLSSFYETMLEIREGQIRTDINAATAASQLDFALQAEAQRQKDLRPLFIWGSRAAYVAGALALGFGTFYLNRTLDLVDRSNEHCRGSLCQPPGEKLRHDADVNATVSTFLLYGGAALVAGGIWAQLAAPIVQPGADAGVSVHLTPTGLRGNW